MSALGRPAVLASCLVLLAASVHPALGGAGLVPARTELTAALALLAALGLGWRAAASGTRPAAGAALVAAGATVLLAALAIDGVTGHHGSMRLTAGQARSHFDEAGPDGRPLGLRPLGFVAVAERVAADGSVTLDLPGGPAVVSAERSVAAGGYRIASPRLVDTGGAARLRISASDGTRTFVADVAPGQPARAGDVTISLEQYFPDFALDERQQPFSRSSEPRNPAALLAVEAGGGSHRAFVLRSMPGVHRVEPLGLAFSLLEVEPERAVDIAVHRHPAALGALAGALLLAVGLLPPLRRAPGAPPEGVSLLAVGCGTLAALALVDGGSVFAWTLRLPASVGRVPLPGVGVLLGAALLAALAGTLLVAARSLAAADGDVRGAARAALWTAAGLVVAATGLAAVRLPAGISPTDALRPLLGIGLSAALTAVVLLATRERPPSLLARLAPLGFPVAVSGVVVAAALAGAASVLRSGTYAQDGVAATAAAGILGLAALEETAVAGLRRAAFLVALAALAVA